MTCRVWLSWRRETGITMIEILVTLVIVSVGLLGAAAMVINGLENNRNAYLRTQANILAYDIADRIRANPEGAESGNYDGFNVSNPPTIPACYSGGTACSPSELADADLASWTRALQGASTGPTLLPDAGGSINRNGDTFTITITWKQVEWSSQDGEFNDDDNQQFQMAFNL
nr:type IV pilus modification protein PilV [Marinobacter oulmenensis]